MDRLIKVDTQQLRFFQKLGRHLIFKLQFIMGFFHPRQIEKGLVARFLEQLANVDGQYHVRIGRDEFYGGIDLLGRLVLGQCGHDRQREGCQKCGEPVYKEGFTHSDSAASS